MALVYEIVQSELGEFVNITVDEKTVKSIKVDEANPEYVAFLESLNDNTETE